LHPIRCNYPDLLICDYLATLIAQLKPNFAFKLFSFPAALTTLVCSILSVFLYKLLRICARPYDKSKNLSGSIRIRDRVSELLQDTQLEAYLDANEQKLILSVVSFKERIAREVMVPRIDVFSISSDTPLKEAIQSFQEKSTAASPSIKKM